MLILKNFAPPRLTPENVHFFQMLRTAATLGCPELTNKSCKCNFFENFGQHFGSLLEPLFGTPGRGQFLMNVLANMHFLTFFATPKALTFLSFCYLFYCFLHFLEAFLTHFAKTCKNTKNAISALTSSTFWALRGFKNVSKSVKKRKKHMNFGSNIFVIFGAILILLGAQFLRDVSSEMHVFKKHKKIVKKRKKHVLFCFFMIFDDFLRPSNGPLKMSTFERCPKRKRCFWWVLRARKWCKNDANLTP